MINQKLHTSAVPWNNNGSREIKSIDKNGTLEFEDGGWESHRTWKVHYQGWSMATSVTVCGTDLWTSYRFVLIIVDYLTINRAWPFQGLATAASVELSIFLCKIWST